MLNLALKPLLGWTIRLVNDRPRLRKAILAVVRRYPRLQQKLRRLHAARVLAAAGIGQAQAPPKNLAHLTPRGRQIYANLKAALEVNKQEAY